MKGLVPAMNLIKNTLSEQIYQILRNDILTQVIPLGEKLTLKTMQQRFGVSSTPVRDAFTRLTEDGLVNYYSNIGVSVIELSRADLAELYQFMGDLDSLAILYSQNHPNRGQLIRDLEQTLENTSVHPVQTSGDQDIQRWISSSDQFHLLFYDYCGNSRLKRAAEKQRSQLTIFSNLYESEPQIQDNIANWHFAICEAYRNHEITKAADLMRKHLAQSLDFALRSLEDLHMS